ncbi:MAG: NitT/TauT family transport system permease protein [Alphaproteobacteria bacterium]|nr:NitT/TauT family transport system permease protein [Alphaproteobacteria bacterium]
MSAARILAPLLLVLGLLALWEGLVHIWQVPVFVLPAPSAIGQALYEDFASLAFSAWMTLRISLTAFVLAVLGGVALAMLFSQSRMIEMALFPLAVILQVTPIVAIAPLIVIWAGMDNPNRALLLMAWIAAFFPVLSNMTLGLRAADHGLLELYRLYGASRWQVLIQIRMPSALPYLLPAMKISGGLALIGTVVAEFVAGSGASMGLAWRIMESGNRLQIAKMFAALLLLSLLGIAVFFCLSALEYLLLRRWHESRVVREA